MRNTVCGYKMPYLAVVLLVTSAIHIHVHVHGWIKKPHWLWHTSLLVWLHTSLYLIYSSITGISPSQFAEDGTTQSTSASVTAITTVGSTDPTATTSPASILISSSATTSTSLQGSLSPTDVNLFPVNPEMELRSSQSLTLVEEMGSPKGTNNGAKPQSTIYTYISISVTNFEQLGRLQGLLTVQYTLLKYYTILPQSHVAATSFSCSFWCRYYSRMASIRPSYD